VLPSGAADGLARKARHVADIEVTGEVGRDAGTQAMRLFEECAEEAHPSELDREAQRHVDPALGADQTAGGGIKLQVSR